MRRYARSGVGGQHHSIRGLRPRRSQVYHMITLTHNMRSTRARVHVGGMGIHDCSDTIPIYAAYVCIIIIAGSRIAFLLVLVLVLLTFLHLWLPRY
jgi:hypothetical protein